MRIAVLFCLLLAIFACGSVSSFSFLGSLGKLASGLARSGGKLAQGLASGSKKVLHTLIPRKVKLPFRNTLMAKNTGSHNSRRGILRKVAGGGRRNFKRGENRAGRYYHTANGGPTNQIVKVRGHSLKDLGKGAFSLLNTGIMAAPQYISALDRHRPHADYEAEAPSDISPQQSPVIADMKSQKTNINSTIPADQRIHSEATDSQYRQQPDLSDALTFQEDSAKAPDNVFKMDSRDESAGSVDSQELYLDAAFKHLLSNSNASIATSSDERNDQFQVGDENEESDADSAILPLASYPDLTLEMPFTEQNRKLQTEEESKWNETAKTAIPQLPTVTQIPMSDNESQEFARNGFAVVKQNSSLDVNRQKRVPGGLHRWVQFFIIFPVVILCLAFGFLAIFW